MKNQPYNALMPRKSKKPVSRPALGLHLAALRKAAGLTQTELSLILSVSQTNIAFWESSDKPPRSDVLTPMAEAFGVSVEVLLAPPGSTQSKASTPRSHAQRLFAAINQLSRSEQRRILSVIEALLTQAALDDSHAP
jgi:transcriptional regulator with XRE-family HTH domain